jgi:hypothetical protein
MTYDANAGTKNFKLYVNGILAASSTVTGNVTPYQFEAPIWLGGSYSWGESQSYRGEVDELRFWKRALTNTEIAANMNKQLVGNENGLVAYYNFNNTTKDITGKGNDGILMYKEAFTSINTVGIKDALQPASFTFSQNYPNPFNSSTIIKYSLPFDSQVIMKIYNAMGQEINILKNEITSAGNHEVQFNSSDLPSGVYFYAIQAIAINGIKNFQEVKKMILKK